MVVMKNKLEKNISTKKDFLYKKDDVSLTFSLNVDNSSQLRAFRQLLQEAVKDIEALLVLMKN